MFPITLINEFGEEFQTDHWFLNRTTNGFRITFRWITDMGRACYGKAYTNSNEWEVPNLDWEALYTESLH